MFFVCCLPTRHLKHPVVAKGTERSIGLFQSHYNTGEVPLQVSLVCVVTCVCAFIYVFVCGCARRGSFMMSSDPIMPL